MLISVKRLRVLITVKQTRVLISVKRLRVMSECSLVLKERVCSNEQESVVQVRLRERTDPN